MSREHILNGVYVSETGTRDEILTGVYLSETVATAAATPVLVRPSVGQAVLSCWSVAAVAVVLPSLMVPQPAVAAPLFKNQNYEIYRAWDAPAPAPITAINLRPPIGGPAPQNPPVIGTRIPLAVQVAWIPPAPAPIVAINLNPPIAGPVATPPPIIGARLPLPVQISWIPPPPDPILAVNLRSPISGPPPTNPPRIGAIVPAAVHVAWLPVPAPIVSVNRLIPAPVTVPPPLIGSRVPAEVQVNWLPLAPAPIVTRNLNPPIGGPVVNNPPFNAPRWIPGAVDVPLPYDLLVRRQGVPASPQVAANVPVGSQVPQAVLSAWVASPPVRIAPATVTISGPAAQNPPIKGSYVPLEVQVGWIPPAPAPIVATNLNPPLSGPSASNPPINGESIPLPVLISWLPPVPAPIVAKNLNPPIAGATPQNPPFAGTKLSTEVQVAWLPLPYAPIVAVNLDPPQSGPVAFFPYTGSVVPVPVQIAWLPQAPAAIVGPKFTSGVVAADNPPFRGTWVPREVQVAWIPPAPQPTLNALVTPPDGPAPAPPVDDTGTVLSNHKAGGGGLSRKKWKELQQEIAAERTAILAAEKRQRDEIARVKREAEQVRKAKITAKAQEVADRRRHEDVVANAENLRQAQEAAKAEQEFLTAMLAEIANQEDEDEVLMLLLGL